MQKVAVEAIVLRLTDYGEADKIASLFTREHGKVSGIARGAKRSRKRFGGALESFAHLNIQLQFAHGDRLATLACADIVSIRPGIRSDLACIGHAAYACELAERLAPEGEENHRLFRLLSCYLERLDSAPPSPSDRRVFAVNLLKILGYQPRLEHARASAETLQLLQRAMSAGSFGGVVFSDESLAEADDLLDPALAAHLDRPLKSLTFLRDCGL